ncbi:MULTISPECIES: hypothetical protein [unclassified Bradyrhizobium]|uniref:hypothetical protein n=1 Tax=unclassified Bradyrhizobium TaxID=2631580 RepID=UPI0024792D70|nr:MULTISPECIES: hypothetical protein [unclassified Bradyrhizobium]WGR70449.1 hypothetical protein MTX24_34650 [Bradyrhizobium sp. ISRA426]WGR82505.1 hypothetical protein MTX21_19750 [Bradyrhizobium sp. ISRA430]WGR85691.1 hypothetical protein MTX25_34330 [Bradyrhizobium sp. ISRA432]
MRDAERASLLLLLDLATALALSALIVEVLKLVAKLGWVCENHPNRAWSAEFGCQCGAGEPCACNRTAPFDEPDVERIIEEVEGEPKMTRH